MSPVARRKIIGVMGSGDYEFADLAEPAGRAVARGGYHLLTGGGAGAMAAAARAFTEVANRPGLSFGILRAAGTGHLGATNPSRPYRARGPNAWVEVVIPTHLPLSGTQGKHDLSRNHINVLAAAAVIVLPGGDGTLSELELALEYGRPALLFLGPYMLAGSDAATLTRRYGSRLHVATGEDDLTEALQRSAGAPCA